MEKTQNRMSEHIKKARMWLSGAKDKGEYKRRIELLRKRYGKRFIEDL